MSPVSIPEIGPGDAESVKWEVTASVRDGNTRRRSSHPLIYLLQEIGAAAMTLTLTSDVLREVSHFDTPLQVLPPGEPLVERELARTTNSQPAVLTYEVYESEVRAESEKPTIAE